MVTESLQKVRLEAIEQIKTIRKQESSIVRDFRTLKALERAGFIKCNGTPKSRERHWTGTWVRVITVEPGPALKTGSQSFTHRGTEYRIKYFDGCFKPFVVRTGVPTPSFV